jgi:hypothetical protein
MELKTFSNPVFPNQGTRLMGKPNADKLMLSTADLVKPVACAEWRRDIW